MRKIIDAFSEYLDDVLVFKSMDTYKYYCAHVKGIFTFFDINMPLEHLNEKNIKDYIIYLKNKGNSNNTINKKIDIINRVLRINGINVYTKKLKVPLKTFDYLTYYEVVRLLEYIDNSNLNLKSKLLLRLALDTGVRLNELLNIQVVNIDLTNNCILLEKTKTDKERFVFFTNDTMNNYLIPYLKNHSGIYLFDISKYGVESLFRRVKKKCNFKKFSPHMLRHTYATILVNNNTNLEFIRCTLGHTNLNTTKRYLHYNQEQLFETYKKQFKINKGK